MKLYEEIYRRLKKRIAAGEFDHGELLPTELELQNTYNVSRITVKHAYALLSEEGIIERIPGKGTILREHSCRQKSRLLGLVLCDFDSTFGERLIKSVEQSARNYGYSVILGRSYDDYQTESCVLTEMTKLGVCGILIQNCHGAFTKNLIELSLNEFPVVSVDRYAKGLLIPSVTSDNFNACVHATEYLLNKGHQKVLLASVNPQSTSTLTERAEGFQQAYIRSGIPFSDKNFITDLQSPITHKQDDIEKDICRLQTLFENEQMTAVVATERFVAELCDHAAHRLGCCFPLDMELICFDCEERMLAESDYTYVRQNEQELGRLAVDQLIKQIDGESVRMRSIVPSELVFGKSTKADNR